MFQEATHKTCSLDEKPWLPGGMKDEQCQSCCSYLSVAQCWTESIAFVSSSLSVLLLVYIQKIPGEAFKTENCSSFMCLHAKKSIPLFHFC